MTPAMLPASKSQLSTLEVGDISALKRRLTTWLRPGGESPLTLRDVGRLVDNDFAMAQEYHTPEGVCFSDLLRESFIARLAALREWDLIEDIFGINHADGREELLAVNIEDMEPADSILKDLGIG